VEYSIGDAAEYGIEAGYRPMILFAVCNAAKGGCGTSSGGWDTMAEVASAWNRRSALKTLDNSVHVERPPSANQTIMSAARQMAADSVKKEGVPAAAGLSATLPGNLPLHTEFGDLTVLFNIRNWFRKACEAKGAIFTGGGIGLGEANIDIELEGYAFNICIKPMIR